MHLVAVMVEHGDDLMAVIVERTKPNKEFAQRMDVVSLVRSVEEMQGCSSTAGEVMAAMTKLPQTPRYQVL